LNLNGKKQQHWRSYFQIVRRYKQLVWLTVNYYCWLFCCM